MRKPKKPNELEVALADAGLTDGQVNQIKCGVVQYSRRNKSKRRRFSFHTHPELYAAQRKVLGKLADFALSLAFYFLFVLFVPVFRTYVPAIYAFSPILYWVGGYGLMAAWAWVLWKRTKKLKALVDEWTALYDAALEMSD